MAPSNPKNSFLSPADQLDHWHRWKDGETEAGRAIFKSYESFIKKFLRRTYGARVAGDAFEDAFSAATVGFYRALDRFDPTQNVQIGTYAIFWMRAEVDEELRFAYDGQRRNARSHAITREVNRELGTTSRQDVPLGEVFDRVGRLLAIEPEGVRTSFEKSSRTKVSMDAKIGPDSDVTIAEKIADPSALPGEHIEQEETADIVRQAVAQLEPRLKRIIELRYSFSVSTEKKNGDTLEAIGDKLGISKERVRQLEHKALGELRKIMSDAKGLDAI